MGEIRAAEYINRIEVSDDKLREATMILWDIWHDKENFEDEVANENIIGMAKAIIVLISELDRHILNQRTIGGK